MKRKATQLGRTMTMEWLEPRLLLAADMALAGGVLTVAGTSGNDTIQVQSKNGRIDGGSGTDNLIGTAALDYLLSSADSIENFLGKSVSDWGVTQQYAGTSRYGANSDSWEFNGAWGY